MQELAVVVIVSLAALYLGGKYMPASARVRLVRRLTRGGRRSRLARWLDTAGGGACGGGGCGSCGTRDHGPTAPGKHRVIKLHQKR